jgi:DNA-binding LacI/PurR family transcriptional regulator
MPHLPRYEKLKQLLRDKIVEDKLRVGDRFYSQNQLMKRYNLSFATVTRALNELEREGYLVRQQGRGTFVRALPSDVESEKRVQRRAAVFIPWDFRNPAHINFQRLYTTIEQSLPPGFHLKLIPYSPDVSELEQFLFTREHFDGVLMVYPSDSHIGFVRKLAQSHPLVVLGRKLEDAMISYVYCDNTKASDEAVTYLLSKGHRSIAIISNSLEMTDSRERLDGYRMALRKQGIAFDESLTIFTHPLELNGYSALLDLMDRNSNRPVTAVFAAGDLIAMGAMAAARAMNIAIPRELSIMGFDDIDEAQSLSPPLTTMHVPIREIAIKAAEVLMDIIETGSEPIRAEFSARLVERDSVGEVHSGYNPEVFSPNG